LCVGFLKELNGVNDVPVRHVAADVVVLPNQQNARMVRLVFLVEVQEIARVLRDHHERVLDGVPEMEVIVESNEPGLRRRDNRVSGVSELGGKAVGVSTVIEVQPQCHEPSPS